MNRRSGAIFVVLLLTLAACGTGRGAGSSSAGPAYQVVRPRQVSTVVPAVAAPNTAPVPASTDPPAYLVATVTVPSLPVYSSPAAPSPEQTLANPNSLGAPLVLLVMQVAQPWVQAYLPERPNGASGWVPAKDVTLTSDTYHLAVSLGGRQLTLYQANNPIFQTPVAVGAPSSPTPPGLFYVTETIRITTPGTPYGPYALGLSGFSDVYTSFDGGPGQVAIHGTDQPFLIGSYASHGCIRLSNSAITQLASQVPAGTPVLITA